MRSTVVTYLTSQANKANVGKWFALPLVNGAEAGNTNPSYKKQGDLVYLFGQIKGITPDIPFSVLPEGFRPGARRVCISPVNPGGTDTVCVTISLNGEIALTSHVEHAELFITLVFAI